MNIRTQIINTIGVNSLFKIEDITFVNKSTLKSLLWRWQKTGDVKKYKNGYYYFMGSYVIDGKALYTDAVDVAAYIDKKFVGSGDRTCGFWSGMDFLANHEFDTQQTVEHLIFSNALTANQLVFKDGCETYTVKRFNREINQENKEYLAFLTCLKNYDITKFDGIYDNGEWSNTDAIKDYVNKLDWSKLLQISSTFSSKVRERLNKIYEITRK